MSLESDFKKFLDKVAAEVLSKKLLEEVGEEVKQRVLKFVRGGQSPIENAGRFPEYKGEAGRRAARSSLRKARASVSGRKAKKLIKISRFAKKAYPFTVQGKFPGKKPRPVNLTLSGDFLRSLETVVGTGQIQIGFLDKLSQDKESGHRKGVNGQPKRPIIPTGSEKFNVTITSIIDKMIKAAIAKYVKGL